MKTMVEDTQQTRTGLGRKAFLDVLQGRQPERIPFWLMRQAGRYLPEYRELRAEKGGFLDMAFDPKAACEVTMQPLRRFDMDAAIIFSDILTIPLGLGQHLEFVSGEGPKLGPLDIDKLSFDDFDKLEPVYEAIENTRAAIRGEGFDKTALIGFAGAPWTVATYMVEGGSSKDFMNTKLLSYQQPEKFAALIDLLTEATSRYLIKQINAGAEAVQIFDSWAGALDEDGFARWSIAPTAKIVAAIRDKFPDFPIIGFPKGAAYNYLRYADETGVTAIGLDQHVPLSWAKDELQSRLPVQGNLDPFALLAGGDALTSGVQNILKTFGDAPFIFNLGHGINKNTPPEHVAQLAKMIRDFKP